MQVTTADGNNTAIAIADYTKIKSSGGFLGLDRDKLPASSLLNGLPVEVDTLQWNGGLVANEVNLKSKDLQIGRATSELQSLMRISYAVFCLKKKKTKMPNSNLT